jgi:hypothetical protein
MKTKHIYIYSLCSLFFMSTGCKKFLEHQPDDRTELNNDIKVNELLANAYPKANYITFAESMSDMAGDKGTFREEVPNFHAWIFRDQVDPQKEDTPPFYWNACYKAIAAANYALEAIDKAGSSGNYRAARGEALVARAYAHFMLVTFFSKTYDPATAATDLGIPYVTKAQKSVEGEYTRGTVESVYANIEKDLLEGLPLINDESYRIPKYHFTVRAANAFATRFYLFKKEYGKVVQHADKVFPTASIVNNLRNWNSLYNVLGYYELQAIYTNSTEPANLLLAETNSYWGRSYYAYTYALNNTILNIVAGAASNPARKSFAVANQIYGSTEAARNIPKFREHFVKPSISANFGDGYNMIPLLTTEEVLFNRAEANVMLGNNDLALADLDAFLSKRLVSYSPTNDKFTVAKAVAFFAGQTEQQALISSILRFKSIEYIHEGMRWFDILRHKIAYQHNSVDGKYRISISADDPRKVLQIPEDAQSIGLQPNPR